MVQGHRGARGHWPENTIEGCQQSVVSGVRVLEIDLVVSGDRQVLVSHEAWFNPAICVDPKGKKIESPKAKENRLFNMPYDSIRSYDCGCKGHPDFPKQIAVSAHKPLLLDLIREVDAIALANDLSLPLYNLEIKCLKSGDNKIHPAPAEFAGLVNEAIQQSGIKDRLLVQSFDKRVLREVKKLDESLKIGLLVVDPRHIRKQIKALGFTPDFYNPWYRMLRPKTIRIAHERSVRVVVWTVNKPKKIDKMIEMGVDGIISDYPERVYEAQQSQ